MRSVVGWRARPLLAAVGIIASRPPRAEKAEAVGGGGEGVVPLTPPREGKEPEEEAAAGDVGRLVSASLFSSEDDEDEDDTLHKRFLQNACARGISLRKCAERDGDAATPAAATVEGTPLPARAGRCAASAAAAPTTSATPDKTVPVATSKKNTLASVSCDALKATTALECVKVTASQPVVGTKCAPRSITAPASYSRRVRSLEAATA